jgi:hypothetical protein
MERAGREEKSVGFRRDIRAAWFDAAATVRVETDDLDAMRRRLDETLAAEIDGKTNRQLTVEILVRLWGRSAQIVPDLHGEALERFAHAERPLDRICLHYGLSLVAFPFFRDGVEAVGQLLRQRGVVTRGAIKQRLIAGRGQLGSLENATAAVLFALRQWGLVAPTERRFVYGPAPLLLASGIGLESWLLSCALCAHPANGIPFPDLIGLPELFPFAFSLTIDDLRRSCAFDVQRLGGGWDLVGASAGR